MITFERTTDAELLKSLLLQYPSIWDAMRDDFSPQAEDFQPYEGDWLWYVLASENEKPFGFFLFQPDNAACYQIHTVMPLNSRAHNAFTGVLGWFFRQVPAAARIVTSVPSSNEVGLRFGLRAGLQMYGLNPRSFMKNDILRDQILMGVSRQEGA